MVKTYDSLRDENDIVYQGRTKLYIRNTEVDADGNFGEFERGNALVFDGSGYQFIVDEYIIGQIDKLKVVDGNLILKDGETLTTPVRTEKELQREALLKQLAELESDMPTE